MTSKTDGYENYANWKGWSSLFSYSQKDRAYFDKELGPYLSKTGAILEIGFGGGRLMGWARDAGHRIVGLEVQKSLVERARLEGYEAYTIDAFNPEPRFDLVVGISVLEHLTVGKMAEILEMTSQALSPDGAAVFRFPNGISPFGRVYQHGDATHLITVTPSLIEQVIVTHDIPLRLTNTKNPRVPLGWRRGPVYVSANCLRLCLRASLYWAISLIVGIPRHLDPNLVVELRRERFP